MTLYRLAAILAVVAFGIAGFLLLPACGLGWAGIPWIDRLCGARAETARDAELATLEDRRAELNRQIQALEREIATIECVADPYERRAEAPPPLPPVPADEPEDEGLDPTDITSLEGCWALEGEYRVQDIRTSEVRVFNDWEICFAPGSDGAGTQVMRAPDGTSCEGTIQGAFTAERSLSLEEPGDLTCSDSSFIYRREATCGLRADGGADCTTLQPETGSRGMFRMQRSR